MNPTANLFFDLSCYAHAALFSNTTPVWGALLEITRYIQTQPLGNIEVAIPKTVTLENPSQISIGKNCTIEPGAFIRGPCIIGENCTIRHGAYIRGDFICGNRCVIGHDTEIKGSIFLDDAHAPHFAYVGDSILGNHVNLGAGVKCANLRLRKNTIAITIDGQSFSTGMRKLGAIIGDRSQIGCNVVTNPGTILGKEVLCYPSLNICGYIPSKSIVKGSSSFQVFSAKDSK